MVYSSLAPASAGGADDAHARRLALPGPLRHIDHLNTAVRHHYPAVLLLIVAVGLLFPGAAKALGSWKLFVIPFSTWQYDFPTLALTLVVLSVSVTCNLDDFAQLLSKPKPGLTMLAAVYLVTPLLALFSWILVHALFTGAAAREIQLGLVFIAIMPVATTAAVWVRVTKGSIALLLAVVGVTFVVSIAAVPAVSRIFIGSAASIVGPASGPILKTLLVSVAMPLVIGLTLNSISARWVYRWLPLFTLLGTIGLLSTMATSVANASPAMSTQRTLLFGAALVTIALNALCFCSGAFIARWLQLSQEDSLAVMFGTGMRNFAIVLFLGTMAFPHLPLFPVPAAIYSISQQIMAAYLATAVFTSTRWLGSAIGIDRDDLLQHLTKHHEFSLSTLDRRRPGLTLLVFCAPPPEDERSDRALQHALFGARRVTRASDYVSHTSPGCAAVALFNTPHSGGLVVIRKLESLFQELLPGVPITWGVSHSNDCGSAAELFDSAMDQAAQDAQQSDVEVAQA